MCPPKNGLKEVWLKDLSAFQLDIGFFRSYSWKTNLYFRCSSFPKGFPTFFDVGTLPRRASPSLCLGALGVAVARNRRPFMKGFLLGGKMDALKKNPMMSKYYLMMISWCVFFKIRSACELKKSSFAEVEDFSGRQTFQVWHSEKLCLLGQWSRSLPRRNFLLSP